MPSQVTHVDGIPFSPLLAPGQLTDAAVSITAVDRKMSAAQYRRRNKAQVIHSMALLGQIGMSRKYQETN